MLFASGILKLSQLSEISPSCSISSSSCLNNKICGGKKGKENRFILLYYYHTKIRDNNRLLTTV